MIGVIGNGVLAGAIIRILDSQGLDYLHFGRSLGACDDQRRIMLDLNFTPPDEIADCQSLVFTAWPHLHDYNSEEHLVFSNKSLTFLKSVVKSSIGLRTLFVCGTCFEYAPSHTILSEQDRTEVSTNYTRAKLELLNGLLALVEGTKCRLVWGRIFHVLHPHPNRKNIISLLEESVVNRQSEFIVNDCVTEFDYLTPIEIADKILRLLDSADKSSRVVNICSGRGRKLYDLLNDYKEQRGYEIKIRCSDNAPVEASRCLNRIGSPALYNLLTTCKK